jgi:hypothetical protein
VEVGAVVDNIVVVEDIVAEEVGAVVDNIVVVEDIVAVQSKAVAVEVGAVVAEERLAVEEQWMVKPAPILFSMRLHNSRRIYLLLTFLFHNYYKKAFSSTPY